MSAFRINLSIIALVMEYESRRRSKVDYGQVMLFSEYFEMHEKTTLSGASRANLPLHET